MKAMTDLICSVLFDNSAAVLQKLVPEKKVFEVHIEPGHRNNSKVVLRGEAGCSDPDVQPGDVVFILEARPHKTFRRIASDLVFEKVSCVLDGHIVCVV